MVGERVQLPGSMTGPTRSTAGASAMARAAKGRSRHRGIRQLRRGAALAAFVAAWEAYARTSGNRLTPSTERILAALWRYLVDGDLWLHGSRTLGAGLAGLGVAGVLGVALGLLMATSRLIDAAVEPLLAGTYAVPKLSIYPAIALVVGIGVGSQVVLVVLECLYPIVHYTYAAARSLHRGLLPAARNAGARRLDVVLRVLLPACLPSILAGIRGAAPIMLMVITAAEMIGGSHGLGYLLLEAQARFQPAGALAIVLVLALLGYILDQIIVGATARIVFW